jgi:hypothetical protein
MMRAVDAYKRGLQLDGRDYQLHSDLDWHAAADYANATKTLLRALRLNLTTRWHSRSGRSVPSAGEFSSGDGVVTAGSASQNSILSVL